jgi:hypothetical protein
VHVKINCERLKELQRKRRGKWKRGKKSKFGSFCPRLGISLFLPAAGFLLNLYNFALFLSPRPKQEEIKFGGPMSKIEEAKKGEDKICLIKYCMAKTETTNLLFLLCICEGEVEAITCNMYYQLINKHRCRPIAIELLVASIPLPLDLSFSFSSSSSNSTRRKKSC